MVVELQGTLADGSAWNGDPKLSPVLRVTQRTDMELRVSVKTPAGVLIRPAAIVTMTLVVKERASGSALISATGVASSTLGCHVFTIAAAQTRRERMPAGFYVYEVAITRSGGVRDVVIQAASFVVRPSIG